MLVVSAGWLRSLPAVGVVAALLTLAAPAAAQTRACDGVGGGGTDAEWGAFDITATGVSCATAQRHIRTCAETKRAPSGWRFRMVDFQPTLTRGARRITWQMAGAGSTCKSSAAQPRWRSCGSIVFVPNTESGVTRIRARKATCQTARRVARASEPTSVVDGPFTYRAQRFTCRGRPRDEGLPTVSWTCTRTGGARVEFVMS